MLWNNLLKFSKNSYYFIAILFIVLYDIVSEDIINICKYINSRKESNI